MKIWIYTGQGTTVPFDVFSQLRIGDNLLRHSLVLFRRQQFQIANDFVAIGMFSCEVVFGADERLTLGSRFRHNG